MKKQVTPGDVLTTVFWVATLLTILLLLDGCSLAPRARPWSKAEVGLAVVSTAAAGWNYHESAGMLDRGCYEMNPVYGRHPSDGELLGGMAATQVLTLAIAHWYPVIDLPIFGECEFRAPLLVGKTVVNAGLAIHDSGVGR
jgi:hypothetical protein